MCASHCAQLLHTILHRTDLIVFPLTRQDNHHSSDDVYLREGGGYKSQTDLCEVVDVEAESAVVKPAVGVVLVTSNSLHKTRHVHGAAENQVTGHSQSKRCHYTLVQNVAERSTTFKILSLLDSAVNS